jgi:hypothetical protein
VNSQLPKMLGPPEVALPPELLELLEPEPLEPEPLEPEPLEPEPPAPEPLEPEPPALPWFPPLLLDPPLELAPPVEPPEDPLDEGFAFVDSLPLEPPHATAPKGPIVAAARKASFNRFKSHLLIWSMEAPDALRLRTEDGLCSRDRCDPTIPRTFSVHYRLNSITSDFRNDARWARQGGVVHHICTSKVCRLERSCSAAAAPLIITLGKEVWETLVAIPSLRARPPQAIFADLYGDAYGTMGSLMVKGRESNGFRW